jgi:predicted enzyme related to lactoylglutathione lyase
MSSRRQGRGFWVPGLLAIFLCAGAAAATAPLDVPAVTVPGTHEHHAGKIIWMDLVTPDVAAEKRFYSGLFGWTFRDMGGSDSAYTVALLEGRPVGGLVQRPIPSGEHRQPAWLTFIAVGDVDAATTSAVAHGAKVLSQPKTYRRRGRQAVLSDPDGAVFALLASSSGDPPDVLAAPGEWIWSSLMTSDAASDAAFYQTVCGYDVFDLASDDGSEHLVLAGDDYARAGVNALPSDSYRRHPHWLNFVRVTDAADAAARAVALGARVLVEPRIDRHGGKIAVIADPSGAPVGLMEWSDEAGKEVAK